MPLTDVTRRAIVDELVVENIDWAGRLEEQDFLRRLYPMDELPSYDGRFTSAAGDVWQHRVRNHDWPDDWVFTDQRFELENGPDDVFLRFLVEGVHPAVRRDLEGAARLVAMYNRHLRADGFELHVTSEISGRPVYGARTLLDAVPPLTHLQQSVKIDSSYLSQQLTRMEVAVVSDPELAVGTAKELIETVAKTILEDCGVEVGRRDDLPKLVRAAIEALALGRDISAASASETMKRLLNNLGSIAGGIAELRNAHGTGHGRSAQTKASIQPRHARLAVGAAAALAAFFIETHEERRTEAEGRDSQ